jgi:hypothetical protein
MADPPQVHEFEQRGPAVISTQSVDRVHVWSNFDTSTSAQIPASAVKPLDDPAPLLDEAPTEVPPPDDPLVLEPPPMSKPVVRPPHATRTPTANAIDSHTGRRTVGLRRKQYATTQEARSLLFHARLAQPAPTERTSASCLAKMHLQVPQQAFHGW